MCTAFIAQGPWRKWERKEDFTWRSRQNTIVFRRHFQWSKQIRCQFLLGAGTYGWNLSQNVFILNNICRAAFCILRLTACSVTLKTAKADALVWAYAEYIC